MTKKIYDRKKISRLFDAGYNNHQIADIIGGNYRTVYDILLDMGKGPSRNSMLDIPKVKALAKAGWTAEQIEYEFGWRFGIETIRQAMQ